MLSFSFFECEKTPILEIFPTNLARSNNEMEGVCVREERDLKKVMSNVIIYILFFPYRLLK